MKVSRRLSALCVLMSSPLFIFGAHAATFEVTSAADDGAGSLREAVALANASEAETVTITFADGLGTIALTSGQLVMTRDLSIIGPEDAQWIDAGGQSRIMVATEQNTHLQLENLVLVNGRTESAGNFFEPCTVSTGEGGAVCARGSLTVSNSVIADNSTNGHLARGGGLYSQGDMTLDRVSVVGNFTEGEDSHGGGLAARGTLVMENCLVAENLTQGIFSFSGGVDAGQSSTVHNCLIRDNGAQAWGSWCGGMFSFGPMTLSHSTLAGNFTLGEDGKAGALGANNELHIINSTISGNWTEGPNSSVGAVVAWGNTQIHNSTITDNSSEGGPAGLALRGASGTRTLHMHSTILAGNSGPEGNFDGPLPDTAEAEINVHHSLFGDDEVEITDSNQANIFTDQPGVLELADNDCAESVGAFHHVACVSTHGLHHLSPALHAGANPLELETDQRGEGFPRENPLQIDIGAFETPSAVIFEDRFESGMLD